jgi:single-strand DNA-binding protein
VEVRTGRLMPDRAITVSKVYEEDAMSQGNYIILSGYVTAEPKLGHTKASQTPVTKIRVGSTPRWLDRTTGEWRDGETSYYNVKCWRKLAENVNGSLRKGDMVLVRGKFRTRTWVDDQQHTRIELEVEADSVGHDLSFGWSRFNRGAHVPPGAMKGLEDGEAARQGMAPEVDLSEDAEFHEGPDDFGGYGGAPGDDGDHSDHGDDGGHGGHGDDRDDRDDRDDLTSGFGQRAAEAAAV